MINKIQRQTIQHLIKQPGWDVILQILDETIVKWSEEEVKADNEFETLWRVAQREAKGRALKEFFNYLEEEASNVD